LRQKLSISLTPFVVRAAVEALKGARLLNGSLEGDEIVLHGHVNVDVSVSTPRGLVVPVVHQAEAKGIRELSSEMAELARRTRENQLSLSEVSGATFTVTNSGVFGSLFFAPRVNPPQSAVLGIGKVMPRPVVREDQIAIREVMIASVSYDHRVIDGETAVRFLQTVKGLLETPERLL
jgi:2-oxoglutarate dehydrogenase E2 component (dihydrolipoamide succinyltransferase)